MSQPKLITVVGVTGGQGNAVVRAFLGDPRYRLRGLTRNPDSEKSKRLTAQGVEVMRADLNDVDSLIRAFAGSYAIFALTDFVEPARAFGPEVGAETEEKYGINMAKAAIATTGLEHYIWSSLPDTLLISGGKVNLPNFMGKARATDFIWANPGLAAKTTTMYIANWTKNFNYLIYRPYYLEPLKVYVQFQSFPSDTPIWMFGDHEQNLLPFVRAILEQPEKTKGQIVSQSPRAGCFADSILSVGILTPLGLGLGRRDNSTRDAGYLGEGEGR